MKITPALIDRLICLRDGKSVPSSALKGGWVEDLLRERALISHSHGSRVSYSVADKDAFMASLSRHHEGLGDLDMMRQLLSESETDRAMQAKVTGNSKIITTRSFPGFLVNCYDAVEASINGQEFTLRPTEGCGCFIFDWTSFFIPEDIVVMGVENPENFRKIRLQNLLFERELPGQRLLFVSRYPQSTDLREWLRSIPNRYIHFGDLDLAGIHIFLSEFHKHLGDRASFFIPQDYESRIQQGSQERYIHQYKKFQKLNNPDPRVQPLVDCIHKHHRCYDQEGWIQTETNN